MTCTSPTEGVQDDAYRGPRMAFAIFTMDVGNSYTVLGIRPRLNVDLSLAHDQPSLGLHLRPVPFRRTAWYETAYNIKCHVVFVFSRSGSQLNL